MGPVVLWVSRHRMGRLRSVAAAGR